MQSEWGWAPDGRVVGVCRGRGGGGEDALLEDGRRAEGEGVVNELSVQSAAFGVTVSY